MNKKHVAVITIVFLLTSVLLIIYRLGSIQNASPSRDSTKLNVVATFYPLMEFTHKVGANNISIISVIQNGTEPHEFEPKAQDRIILQNADIIVYNGSGFEPWFDKIKDEAEIRDAVQINSSQDIQGEQNLKEDPHVWIDPVRAQKIVEKIAAVLIDKDKKNAEIYTINRDEYILKLKKLDTDYEEGLRFCKKDKVITSHDAFGYLATRYNFTAIPISGFSPDDEPSPQKLAEIAKIARSNDIKFIFVESLVSPELSDTIAKEVGAQTLVFNPIEGLTEEQISQNKEYIDIQYENLANIRKALECK